MWTTGEEFLFSLAPQKEAEEAGRSFEKIAPRPSSSHSSSLTHSLCFSFLVDLCLRSEQQINWENLLWRLNCVVLLVLFFCFCPSFYLYAQTFMPWGRQGRVSCFQLWRKGGEDRKEGEKWTVKPNKIKLNKSAKAMLEMLWHWHSCGCPPAFPAYPDLFSLMPAQLTAPLFFLPLCFFSFITYRQSSFFFPHTELFTPLYLCFH